jgi:release factor H-coupled RctB family protein
MCLSTLPSDFILGYQTTGICGSILRCSVSGGLARQCSDTHLSSYLCSTIGIPDLHKSDRFSIGCPIAAEGLYSTLIGSDIGCGIALHPLGSIPSHLTPEKFASRLYNRHLDRPWDDSPRDWLARYEVTQHAEFDESLGAVGAGNHFTEGCKVERIVKSEACESIGLRKGEMHLWGGLLEVMLQSSHYGPIITVGVVYTGSHGLWSSILRSFTKSDANPYFITGSAELRTHFDQHDYAIKWAQANHDLVAHCIKYCPFDKGPNLLNRRGYRHTHDRRSR